MTTTPPEPNTIQWDDNHLSVGFMDKGEHVISISAYSRLVFSGSISEKYLKKVNLMHIGYAPETHEIYVKPVDAGSKSGYRLHRSGKNRIIQIGRFCNRHKIHHDKLTYYWFDWDADQQMGRIDLNEVLGSAEKGEERSLTIQEEIIDKVTKVAAERNQ